MAGRDAHSENKGHTPGSARGRDQGRSTFRIRMPGFVADDEDVGLGDVIKRATSAVGIQPCAGCQRRAEALNRWVAFSGRHSSGRRGRE
jgi:hypothetical protein